MKTLLVLSCTIVTTVFIGWIGAQSSFAKEDKLIRSVNAIPGRYIVVLSPEKMERYGSGSVESEAVAISGRYGANVDEVYETALSGFSAEMSEDAAIELSKDERVLYVEEDALITAQATQSNATWGLDRIDQRNLPLNTAFQYATTGAGVHAYVIDSGIRSSHQDFGGRASSAVDFTNDGQNGNDCYGHGTHVAGTIGSSTFGVAKGVTLHAVRVLRCDGSGQVSELLAAVNWVTANRINPAVANISITASGISNSLDNAITASIASGVTYSVAAGNFGSDTCLFSPARVPNALTVGAIASHDGRPGYSNQGACLDLYAPGNGVISLGIADDVSTRTMNGTSMAAPHVAGVAALYLQSNPTASPATVAQQIMNGTTQGVVWNTDGVSPNRLLYSWIGGQTPPPMPARVTIIKQVTTLDGGTASNRSFGYAASNLGTSGFSLVDNDAPPADRFENPNVTVLEGVNDITVTEASLSGWELSSIQCVETPGSGMTNQNNTTVDLANRSAVIKVEQGESVTCTFTSQELDPTAAPVSISGRITDTKGRGVGNIRLKVQDPVTGQTSFATTSSFGYYTVENLEVLRLYVITAMSKRYTFTPESRTLVLQDDLMGSDFQAIRN